MGWKSRFIRPYAALVNRRVNGWKANPIERQEAIFRQLIVVGRKTAFGRDHLFSAISDHHDFCRYVPIREYEDLAPWINRVAAGEEDVLWPGKPLYFAKTSGTTSGTKFIPITKDSLSNHYFTAQTALMCYMYQTGNYGLVDGKMIFLSGSPQLEAKNGILIGRLSGIVNHQVPSWLKGNQLPSWKTNCIDDWEEKVAKIVEETRRADMRLISGIPPWALMYFDLLYQTTGRRAGELFPNFSVFVFGGVNYEPYRSAIERAIGRKVDSIETYPASEGFIAFQDLQEEPGLLLNADSGIFFEFVPADQISKPNPPRIPLEGVTTGVNYAVILSSNSGLWAYNLGDTVKFVSTDPYRLVVTGRVKHFVSAFGEHVISEEVEGAMQAAVAAFGLQVTEFTVAPVVRPEIELPYHEWLIEFVETPANLEEIAAFIDRQMQQSNVYYKDLITGKVLQTLKIRPLPPGAFIAIMKKEGKLGGQNKVPRLADNRNLADRLLEQL